MKIFRGLEALQLLLLTLALTSAALGLSATIARVDLGFMLLDMDFSEEASPRARFFRAKLNGGVIDVPAWDSPEVLG